MQNSPIYVRWMVHAFLSGFIHSRLSFFRDVPCIDASSTASPKWTGHAFSYCMPSFIANAEQLNSLCTQGWHLNWCLSYCCHFVGIFKYIHFYGHVTLTCISIAYFFYLFLLVFVAWQVIWPFIRTHQIHFYICLPSNFFFSVTKTLERYQRCCYTPQENSIERETQVCIRPEFLSLASYIFHFS
jgi:hypothetical protein